MSTITRRKFVETAGICAASLALAGCGSSTTTSTTTESATTEAATEAASSDVTLVVFAAASMTESLEVANEAFTAQTGIAVSPNYDSSGTLKTQIQEGAECDVFISAGQKQMNQMDAEDTTGTNTEGLDLVESDTRFDILENEVTLVVPTGNPANIRSFDDLAEHLKAGDIVLAMGNSDVPVGQYTQKILAYYELDESELANAGLITYGTNVKEVTTQVGEAAVDCGVIYRTDAVSANADSEVLEIVDVATKDMCGQVVYPAAAIKGSAHLDEAKEYLEFLKGSEASEAFEAVGFKPLASE